MAKYEALCTCKNMFYQLRSAYTQLSEANKDESGWNANNLSCMFKVALHVSVIHEKKWVFTKLFQLGMRASYIPFPFISNTSLLTFLMWIMSPYAVGVMLHKPDLLINEVLIGDTSQAL